MYNKTVFYSFTGFRDGRRWITRWTCVDGLGWLVVEIRRKNLMDWGWLRYDVKCERVVGHNYNTLI